MRHIQKLNSLLTTLPTSLIRFAGQQIGFSLNPHLYYVVPNHNWVTDWIGYYITTHIHTQFNWSAQVTHTPQLLTGHILHYGELGSFLHSLGSRRNHHNTIVTTIFHGDRTSPELNQPIEKLIDHIALPARILTSCTMMHQRLMSWGALPEQVVCIPLGIDLKRFTPPHETQRLAIRRQLGIPDDAICIGSFQKDGEGWGEGLKPKLIKGPDIFLGVIKKLKQQYNLFVLLTGPARGYVKTGLDRLGVPYYHQMLNDYQEIIAYYHCLDMYLVASREEGGPKAVLEALATGVPLVSTKVGLAPDVIHHHKNGLLVDVGDIDGLAEAVASLIEHHDLRAEIIHNGLHSIVNYDWSIIAKRYYTELYEPLIGAI